jgi:hypothetical protein
MIEWINANGLIVLVIMFLFSNIVSSLPSPDKVGKPWYEFLHKFLNLVAANAPKAIPQLRMFAADRNKDAGQK